MIHLVLFGTMVLSLAFTTGIYTSSINSMAAPAKTNAWLTLTHKAIVNPKQNYIMGAAGIYVSACASAAAEFAWAGPWGAVAGIVASL